MTEHIHPSKIAETIAAAVYEAERLTAVQLKLCCEAQPIIRMDFAMECDKDTLDMVVKDLAERGLTVATSPGTHDHLIYVDIVP